MIPSHARSNAEQNTVVINRLSKSNDYDYSQPHRHDYYELFYFQKGGGVHEIDFKPFDIQSASFQLVVPGQVHQMRRAPGSMGFVFLFTNEDVIESKTVFDFLLDHSLHGVDEREPICDFEKEEETLIDAVVQDAWKNQSMTSNAVLRNTLIGLCLRMKERTPLIPAVPSTDYARFRQLVAEKYIATRTVSSYAEALNLTPRALNLIVKKHSGKTASEHVYQRVVLEAKRLLLLGNSVKEVAFSLNFDDPAHFSKFFKKQAGIAPAEFRNVHV